MEEIMAAGQGLRKQRGGGVTLRRSSNRNGLLGRIWRTDKLAIWAHQSVMVAVGAFMIASCTLLLLALLSYDQSDPSLNNTGTGFVRNWLGPAGAYSADLLLQWLGLAGLALILPLGTWGLGIIRRRASAWRQAWPIERLPWVFLALFSLALGLGAFGSTNAADTASGLPAGWGGAVGTLVHPLFVDIFTRAGWPALSWLPGLLLILSGLLALGWSLALESDDWRLVGQGFGWTATLGKRALHSSRMTMADVLEAESDALPPTVAETSVPRRAMVQPAATGPRVVPPNISARRGQREGKERQGALALGDDFRLPSLSLLTEPPRERGKILDNAALERNARFLETVLQDFGVQGRIAEVRPGPVVTMYELEPAPGIKASRVIGLADDIARSMSAISARVAVVPGRNVIGIELPNKMRETVYLRDLMASDAFEAMKGPLPLILGKNIAGEPVIADLAPMPHLLIAGATGAGKSVGLNAMILSLLYRLTPKQCRFIMIDPKMLELSIYDGIPHLLAPVVTEPKKAIVALKWAVREMDERYGRMSKLAVRNIAQFNDKVREAQARGQSLSRRVHTGYDESGKPVYEEQLFDFEEMPLLVVVVDELADLMMVAGKEIEFLIQRLAQKARAAGIHLILATQRPSVDVITGVIKANLPTRVSFAVTSKIDSRTILNEQGAETLLGKGDMLFMQGGRMVQRVHGPLVSEAEVEQVATHWRAQGMPDYLDQVTEDPEEEPGLGLEKDQGDDLLSRAISVVATEQKCSTSFIQRHLRIGYNNAARLVDQMEKMGYVSVPDHVGRREVLIDEDGVRR